jgi:hypothetical protein
MEETNFKQPNEPFGVINVFNTQDMPNFSQEIGGNVLIKIFLHILGNGEEDREIFKENMFEELDEEDKDAS